MDDLKCAPLDREALLKLAEQACDRDPRGGARRQAAIAALREQGLEFPTGSNVLPFIAAINELGLQRSEVEAEQARQKERDKSVQLAVTIKTLCADFQEQTAPLFEQCVALGQKPETKDAALKIRQELTRLSNAFDQTMLLLLNNVA